MAVQQFADVVPGAVADGEIVRQLIEAEKGYGEQGYERTWLSAADGQIVLRSNENGISVHNPVTGAVLAWASGTGFLVSKDDGATPVSVPIVTGTAAGGDLAGTYPNPTLATARARQLVQPGEGTLWYGTAGTIPSGRLLCNGADISRTTYAALFAVIGTAYGPGDGSTTFTLPNLQGRFVVGVGSNGAISFAYAASGGVAAGQLDLGHVHAMAHVHSITHDHGMTHTHSHAHSGPPHTHPGSHSHGFTSGNQIGASSSGTTGAVSPVTVDPHHHTGTTDSDTNAPGASFSGNTGTDASGSSASSTGGTSAANSGGTSVANTTGTIPSLATTSILPPYVAVYHLIAY